LTRVLRVGSFKLIPSRSVGDGSGSGRGRGCGDGCGICGRLSVEYGALSGG